MASPSFFLDRVSGVRILSISGSPRSASTNTALLRTAQTVTPTGIDVVLFERMSDLPHFNPDDDPTDDVGADRGLHPAVAELRSAVAASQAVLLCTPEYAGALPGSFKNLLDWTVGGTEMYRKPVAWVNVSASPGGAADAHASLARVLGYLHADVVAAACVRIPVTRAEVGDDGLIASPIVRQQIVDVLTTLARHVAHLPGPAVR
jgi:chromate reductase